MFRIHVVLTTFLLLIGLGLAQDAPAGDQEAIRLLVQQVQELQEKVKTLEANQAAASAAAQPSLAPQAASPSVQETVGTAQTPAANHDFHDLRGIRWLGFGEVNYKVLDQRQPELGTFGFVPGSAGNFYTGDFDLFLSSKLSDKVSVLSEIAFGERRARTFSVDLERFLLKYDFDDYLKVSFGRYQTGIGYYNSEFRGAKWLLTTADRPLVMEFADEGGLLPTQSVGVSITGLIPSGKVGLNYVFEYGSSDTVRPDIDGSGNVDEENNGNHVLAGFFVRPDWVPGLRVGGSFYHDKISRTDEMPVVRFGQTLVNAHVIYVHHGIEFLNEGFLIRHSLEGTHIVYNQPAFYSQLSRQFRCLRLRLRPFFRYQYVNANEDGFFNDVRLRYSPSFGARYDFSDNIAFKTQLDHTVRKGLPDLNGLQLQLVFAF
jgi:hypothetical protein